MRDKPFPFYEDWLVLFGKDRATGELVEGVVDMVDNMNLEELDANVDGLPTDVPKETHSRVPLLYAPLLLAKERSAFMRVILVWLKLLMLIGYAKGGRITGKNLSEASMMLPLTIKQRCRALRLLSKDDNLVDIFYSMSENMERMKLIEGLLEES
ncbi:hypothetical protein Dimus_027691 [Dionaea muscipula]